MIFHKVGGPDPHAEYPWHVFTDNDETRLVEVLGLFREKAHAEAFAGMMRILHKWENDD